MRLSRLSRTVSMRFLSLGVITELILLKIHFWPRCRPSPTPLPRRTAHSATTPWKRTTWFMEITVSNGGRQIQRNHRWMIHQSKRSSWTGVEDEEISYSISLFFLLFKRHCCNCILFFLHIYPLSILSFYSSFSLCTTFLSVCVLISSFVDKYHFQSNNNHYYLFSFWTIQMWIEFVSMNTTILHNDSNKVSSVT